MSSNNISSDNKSAKAIVLLSGGLDSATVLAIASQKFDCHALSFNYAQRSLSEINAAQRLADVFGASFQVIHIDEGDFVLLTHQMTSVPTSILISPIHSLEAFRNEIIGAIDFLITGV